MENDAWVKSVKIIETLDDHVFGSFNHVEMKPSKQGNWNKVHMNVKHRLPLPNIFCMPTDIEKYYEKYHATHPRKYYMLRFNCITGKIKGCLNETWLESHIIMLILTFYHVEVRPSELGNWQTGDSCVKHRSPPPTPSIPWHVLDAINESLKEKNNYNLTWLC